MIASRLSLPACTPITSLGAITGTLTAGCPMVRSNSKAQTRYVTNLGVRARTAADPILLRPLCQPRPSWCPRDGRSPRLNQSRLQGGDHLGQGPQGPVRTVGHAEELQSGLGEVLSRLATAGRLRTGLGDDGARRLHFGRAKPGSRQQGAQHAAVPGRAAFERDQRRQRLLAVLEVTADRLARLRAGAPDAEHVVHHLECDAKVVAELAGLLQRRLADAGCQAAEPGGALEQGRSLEADHLHVLVDRYVDTLFELQVDHLAATEGEHRRGTQGQRRPRAVGIAGRQQIDDGARDERLKRGTRVDGLARAPDLPDRGPAAAQLAVVLDVVEYQP